MASPSVQNGTGATTPSSTLSTPAQTSATSGLAGRGAKRAAAGLIQRVRDNDTSTNVSEDDEDDESEEEDVKSGPKNGLKASSSKDGTTASTRPDKKKRKRNRQALSCSECKRRKIKCDRHIPCEACIRRGEEKECHWEEKKIEVAPQPFALASEHEILKARVAQLEAYISKNSNGSFKVESGAAIATPSSTSSTTTPNVVLLDETSPMIASAVAGPSSVVRRDADTEDAALVLTTGFRAPNSEGASPLPSIDTSGQYRRSMLSQMKFAPSISAPSPTSQHPDRPANRVPPLLSRATESLLVPLADASRRPILDEIWNSVPSSKQFVDWLIHNYFANYDWSWHLHHIPTFQAEYEAFQSLCSQGRRDEVDPLWLAIFFQTLCLSVHFLEEPVSRPPMVIITESDLGTLPAKYFAAAEKMLEFGNWTAVPRFRTLQAISLFSPYLLWMGNQSSGERHRTYIQHAIRMARSLGLHRLGDDPAVMPVEDPGLPSGVHTLRREMALRLLRNLVFVEWVSTNKLPPEMTPNLINSALPGNYDDADLVQEGIVAPRPYYNATDVSFDLIKWKIALVQRAFNDIVHGDAPLGYSSILDLDRSYREIIDSFPTRYLPSYVAPLGEPLTTLWSRSMALQTINSRLVRLHRPFMYRGYTEAKYRPSTDSAIVGARTVLMCQQSLDRAPPVKGAFQPLAIQMAVVVLFLAIWQDFTRTVVEGEDYRLIQGVAGYFERLKSSREQSVRNVATQTHSIIVRLSQAVEERRAAAESRVSAGGVWDDPGEIESFGQLLQRLGAPSAMISAMGLSNPRDAADHIFSDRPHDWSRNVKLESGTSTAGDRSGSTNNTPLGSMTPITTGSGPASVVGGAGSGLILGATPGPSVWAHDGEVPSAVLDESTTTSWSPTDLALNFNLQGLMGPEYADVSFDFDAFTTRDLFNLDGFQ